MPERETLRAIESPGTAALEPSGPPSYADVTSQGGRKPILPAWLRGREAFRDHCKAAAGHQWYLARFHGLRLLPVYAPLTVFWSVAGLLVLALAWAAWCLAPVPAEAHLSARAEGWRAWKSLHHTHKETVKGRLTASAVTAACAVFALELLWLAARWAVPVLGVLALLAAARFGRPEGVRIVTPARVPSQYEKLTPDIIVRALGSLGIAKIDAWLRDGREIVFPHPVRQDGPGWRAEIDLPYGATATMVMERREQFASGLRRPLGAVWPEPVTTEHTGRLEVWVGRQDVSQAKAPPWPLLRSGQADVFRPMPFAVDVRQRKVAAPLIYHNWLIGSIPRQGKTATVREIALFVALDPIAEEWVHELKGTGDLDPLEPVCARFTSGIRDENMAYAAKSLAMLRAECERRGPLIKALPPEICPEKRVTREIARRHRKLRPIVCVIDEAQNLFLSRYAKQAEDDAQFVIKVGPAMGIVLILATQRPDKESLPKGISANVSIRFCLYVTGQVENDMILGTSAYKNGLRATLFRPEIDAGLGYLKGAAPAPVVCRPHFLDMAAAKTVVARARVLRERAGTLPGPADAEDAPRDVRADALAVFGDDPGLHWQALAERLARRFPERWEGVTDGAVSAQMRDLGVRSVTVSMGGQKARGCRKDAIEAAAR